jgi:hypothetical protein
LLQSRPIGGLYTESPPAAAIARKASLAASASCRVSWQPSQTFLTYTLNRGVLGWCVMYLCPVGPFLICFRSSDSS